MFLFCLGDLENRQKFSVIVKYWNDLRRNPPARIENLVKVDLFLDYAVYGNAACENFSQNETSEFRIPTLDEFGLKHKIPQSSEYRR